MRTIWVFQSLAIFLLSYSAVSFAQNEEPEQSLEPIPNVPSAEIEAPSLNDAELTNDPLAADSGAAETQDYLCTMDGLRRRVQVEYATPPSKVPCEVTYYKDSEAPEAAGSILWSANNQVGYCEEKARDFVAKLGSWGWSCTEP